MELKDWLLPLLSLTLAVIPLYPDLNQKRRVAFLILALLVASTGAAVYYNQRDSNQAKQQKSQDDTRINSLIQVSQHASNNTDWIRERLTESGNLAALKAIDTAFHADSARDQLAAQVTPDATAVHVVYYPKQVEDAGAVEAALRQAGFQVELRPARLADVKTGVVWAGDKVSVDVAKYIALTMVRAGVELKAVQRFENGGGAKQYLVEIGGDAALKDAPPLSVSDIRNMSKLIRPAHIEYGY